MLALRPFAPRTSDRRLDPGVPGLSPLCAELPSAIHRSGVPPSFWFAASSSPFSVSSPSTHCFAPQPSSGIVSSIRRVPACRRDGLHKVNGYGVKPGNDDRDSGSFVCIDLTEPAPAVKLDAPPKPAGDLARD